jgi:basic membrane protein A and related proteins
MRRGSKLVALLAVLVLLAVACGKKTPAAGGTTSPQKKLGAGTTVCVVSDEAGFDDKSFNESAKNGVEQAVQQYGVTAKYLESKTSQDYTPNVTACLGQGAKMIVTVGFRLDKATSDAAKFNPNVKFEIVDFAYDPPIANVLGLTFKTDDAAFLAGYLAAGTSKTGKVGTFGGVNIPTVTIFENGFAAGVLKYKQDTRRSVQVLGWDPLKQNGTFSGDFTNQAKGKQIGEDLLSEGADIILPVAGDVGLGTARAIQEAGGNAALIWVDADGCGTVPQICPLILTTVEKHMKKAVFLGIEEMLKGSFPGGTTYLGTLKNDGVGLAPFHEWDRKIPADLKSKLDELKKGVIDGTVSVDPKSYSP